jgi:hygromycin-B 7''-O-kinase
MPRDAPEIAEVAREVARRVGTDAVPALFPRGSLPVFAAGDVVVKLFPAEFAHELPVERAALEACAGRLPVPTPRVVGTECVGTWSALAMTRLRGTPLSDVWPTLGSVGRRRLAEDAGRALAVLHALASPGVGEPAPDWDGFVDAQRRACPDVQRARGLGSPWADDVPAFLSRVPLGVAPAKGFLHTEVMPDHLLVERDGDGWRLSGLLDFEPAMRGAREYELASIGVYWTGGEGAALRALLLAYGYAASDLDGALSRRLLAYVLLHRYSNLARYLAMRPPPRGVTTLPALASRWFAFDGEPELVP